MPLTAHDDMIMDCDAQPLARVDDIACDRNVASTGCELAGGMIVRKHQRCGVELQRSSDHFAWIDRALVVRTNGEQLILNEAIVRGKIKHPHVLDLLMGKRALQIVDDLVEGSEDAGGGETGVQSALQDVGNGKHDVCNRGCQDRGPNPSGFACQKLGERPELSDKRRGLPVRVAGYRREKIGQGIAAEALFGREQLYVPATSEASSG